MKFLNKNWKSRSAIIIVVSVLTGLLMMTLEHTQFASNINASGWHHGGEGKPDIPGIVLFILPFIKALVLIGVPLLLARVVAKILGIFSSKGSR